MERQYAVVLTTCANKEDAKCIIDALLTNQLAACIQTFQINSFYSWKGEICNDGEIALLIKCNRELYPQIEATIIQHHTYELPEIILLPIEAGLKGYLDWIDDVSSKMD